VLSDELLPRIRRALPAKRIFFPRAFDRIRRPEGRCRSRNPRSIVGKAANPETWLDVATRWRAMRVDFAGFMTGGFLASVYRGGSRGSGGTIGCGGEPRLTGSNCKPVTAGGFLLLYLFDASPGRIIVQKHVRCGGFSADFT